MLSSRLVSRVAQVRQMSGIAGPPRFKISVGERIAAGLLIAGAILSVPTWVLLNLESYKKKD